MKTPMNILKYILGRKDHAILHYKGYRYDIYRCPSTAWMPQDQLKCLQGRINDIVLRTCGRAPTSGIYVDAGLMKNKTITIISKDGVDHAFNSLMVIGEHNNRKVVHIGPVYSATKNKGFMTLLLFFPLTFMMLGTRFHPFYITNITHVPRVFGMFMDICMNAYPNTDYNARPTPDQTALKKMLIKTYITEIEPKYKKKINDDFILRDFRLQEDGSIIPFPHTPENVPKFSREEVNERCINLLNYTRGDALIQVGEVALACYYRNNSHSLIRILKKGT